MPELSVIAVLGVLGVVGAAQQPHYQIRASSAIGKVIAKILAHILLGLTKVHIAEPAESAGCSTGDARVPFVQVELGFHLSASIGSDASREVSGSSIVESLYHRRRDLKGLENDGAVNSSELLLQMERLYEVPVHTDVVC
jgi:hypothetical protein